MGISINASIIVGLEVEHEDFWIGRTCNPSFAKYIGNDNPYGQAGAAWHPERISIDEQFDAHAFGDPTLTLLCADAVQNPETPPQKLVLGFNILQISDIAAAEFSPAAMLSVGDQRLTQYFDRFRSLGCHM